MPGSTVPVRPRRAETAGLVIEHQEFSRADQTAVTRQNPGTGCCSSRPRAQSSSQETRTAHAWRCTSGRQAAARPAADLRRERRASIVASVHRVPTAGAAPRPPGGEPIATGSSSMASSARLFTSGNPNTGAPGPPSASLPRPPGSSSPATSASRLRRRRSSAAPPAHRGADVRRKTHAASGQGREGRVTADRQPRALARD